ncbi:unnamed protein product [Lymnaea stagnalis]|uniref:Uncharacterized protein n=1 Tax=Lymnaea stagnalis TaxID=6523 RepID=A0AAV2ISU6_LYMST
MNTLVVKLLVAFAFFGYSTDGAAFMTIGECPNGHKPGDAWSEEGQCERCDCMENWYACYSCGVYAIALDPLSCYHYREDQKAYPEEDQKAYPECCKPIIKCRGDEGFNETMLLG